MLHCPVTGLGGYVVSMLGGDSFSFDVNIAAKTFPLMGYDLYLQVI